MIEMVLRAALSTTGTQTGQSEWHCSEPQVHRWQLHPKLKSMLAYSGTAVLHVRLVSALQAVVVGCSDGWLYFLDITSGRQRAVVDTAGAIKSPPVVDSWQGWGCLWMASHGKHLLACSSQGKAF